MVDENLIDGNLRIRSSIETRGISDYIPITLTVRLPEEKPSTPFKFNPLWLEEEEYRAQIQNT